MLAIHVYHCLHVSPAASAGTLLEEVLEGGGLLGAGGLGPLESQPSKLELRRFTALSFELLAPKATGSCNVSCAAQSHVPAM